MLHAKATASSISVLLVVLGQRRVLCWTGARYSSKAREGGWLDAAWC
jgi:hypothetical protein